jgi:hypothetical protein
MSNEPTEMTEEKKEINDEINRISEHFLKEFQLKLREMGYLYNLNFDKVCVILESVSFNLWSNSISEIFNKSPDLAEQDIEFRFNQIRNRIEEKKEKNGSYKKNNDN